MRTRSSYASLTVRMTRITSCTSGRSTFQSRSWPDPSIEPVRPRPPAGCRGARVLDGVRDGVDPEAVDAAIEPEAHHLADRGRDLGIAPVEVRLLGVERVEVVLAARRVELPGRAPNAARQLFGARRRPLDRPTCTSRVAETCASARLREPRMLDRGVARDQVEQQPQPARVAGGHERVEVGERPVLGRDIGEIGDVVAEVGERRWVDGGEPDASTPSEMSRRWSRRAIIPPGRRSRRRWRRRTCADRPGRSPRRATRGLGDVPSGRCSPWPLPRR